MKLRGKIKKSDTLSERSGIWIELCLSYIFYLFSSGLYRRCRNFTRSALEYSRVHRLYCRYGISPIPKDIIIICFSKTPCYCFAPCMFAQAILTLARSSIKAFLLTFFSKKVRAAAFCSSPFSKLYSK